MFVDELNAADEVVNSGIERVPPQPALVERS